MKTKKMSPSHWRFRLLKWAHGREVEKDADFLYAHYCPLFHYTNLLVLFSPIIALVRAFYTLAAHFETRDPRRQELDRIIKNRYEDHPLFTKYQFFTYDDVHRIYNWLDLEKEMHNFAKYSTKHKNQTGEGIRASLATSTSVFKFAQFALMVLFSFSVGPLLYWLYEVWCNWRALSELLDVTLGFGIVSTCVLVFIAIYMSLELLAESQAASFVGDKIENFAKTITQEYCPGIELTDD